MADSPARDFQSASPLLRLSPEIRLMIYNYFFHGVVLRSEYHRDDTSTTKTAERVRPDSHGCRGRETLYTVTLQQGTFRRYHDRESNTNSSAESREIRDKFLPLLQVNQLLRREAMQTMYNHVHVVLPGHNPLRHQLLRIYPNLLRNTRSLELAMSPDDKLSLDFRRLPKLETLLLDFRDRPKAYHIYYSLPPPEPFLGYCDSPDMREYRAACRAGNSPWRKHIEWIRDRLAQQRRVRVLYCSQSSPGRTYFRDVRTGYNTGDVEYEYEEDVWLDFGDLGSDSSDLSRETPSNLCIYRHDIHQFLS